MTKSVSHWYARYVGDYMKKTQNLSMVEHGAYTLLLDYYYSTGEPIPANAEQMHRICRAFAPVEQQAVQTIINKYFVLDGDVYRNSKADEELLKRSQISEKRSNAAKAKQANAPTNASANAPANGDTSTPTSTIKPPKPPKDDEPWKDDKVYLKAFNTFPAKRRGSKKDGYRAWKNAIERESPEVILRAIEFYSKSEDATKEGGKFAKGFPAWLNGDRWTHDYGQNKPQTVGTLGYSNVTILGGRRD